jgi:hypothetical protein
MIVPLRCSACAGSIPAASLVQFVLVLSCGIRQGVSQDGARRFSCHGRLWLCGIISEIYPYDRHHLVLYSWLTGAVVFPQEQERAHLSQKQRDLMKKVHLRFHFSEPHWKLYFQTHKHSIQRVGGMGVGGEREGRIHYVECHIYHL